MLHSEENVSQTTLFTLLILFEEEKWLKFQDKEYDDDDHDDLRYG